jgi:tight adherence protein B
VAGLPEVLRRLAAELAAGRTLERALASAGRSGPAELGEALRGAGEGLARGVPLERALTSALPRDPACRLLAAALALHRRSGGDLPALCRDLARTLDERQRVEAETAALTAQARLSARVVPLLPPASLLALSALDPAALRLLLGTPAGLLLLGLAGALNLGGALAVRRLVRGIG